MTATITQNTIVPPEPDEITKTIESYPSWCQPDLRSLRALIFTVADETDGVGEIEETLKWGQPSYLTRRPRSGSTIRLGVTRDQSAMAVFVHCQTTLLSTFRDRFPDDFRYEGNRAVVFGPGDPLQEDKLRFLISHALTYNRHNK